MVKLIYQQVEPISRKEAEHIFASDDAEAICDALVRLSYHHPEPSWVEEQCVRFSANSQPAIRATAILSLGHLARIHHHLNLDLILPVLDKLLSDPDPYVKGRIQDTLDDIRQFVKK